MEPGCCHPLGPWLLWCREDLLAATKLFMSGNILVITWVSFTGGDSLPAGADLTRGQRAQVVPPLLLALLCRDDVHLCLPLCVGGDPKPFLRRFKDLCLQWSLLKKSQLWSLYLVTLIVLMIKLTLHYWTLKKIFAQIYLLRLTDWLVNPQPTTVATLPGFSNWSLAGERGRQTSITPGFSEAELGSRMSPMSL